MDWLRGRIRNLPFYGRLRRVHWLYTALSSLGVLWNAWKPISDVVGHIQNAILMLPYIGELLKVLGTALNTQAAGNIILGIGLIGILYGLFRRDPPAARQLNVYLSDKKPEIDAYVKENAAGMLAPKKIIEVRTKEILASTPTSSVSGGTITVQYAVLADVDTKESRKAQKTETLDITLEATVQKKEGQYFGFAPQAVVRIR